MHHSCREKKDTEVQCLETTKDGEAENLGGIEKENEELRETLVKLKNHYAKVSIWYWGFIGLGMYFTVATIFLDYCNLCYIFTTEICNTGMERKFCGLFGNIFKNWEKWSYEAIFAFFWQVAEMANKPIY